MALGAWLGPGTPSFPPTLCHPEEVLDQTQRQWIWEILATEVEDGGVISFIII